MWEYSSPRYPLYLQHDYAHVVSANSWKCVLRWIDGKRRGGWLVLGWGTRNMQRDKCGIIHPRTSCPGVNLTDFWNFLGIHLHCLARKADCSTCGSIHLNAQGITWELHFPAVWLLQAEPWHFKYAFTSAFNGPAPIFAWLLSPKATKEG